jgi:hypothetical protein
MENLINEHIKAFNKEPYIIGMFWNNQEQLVLNIEKAIETNKPYNEYELLSKEEQKAFDNGELLF